MNNEELINTIREVVRSEVRSEISGLKDDVSGLKDDVSELKVKVDGNTAKLDKLNTTVDRIDNRQKGIFEQTAGLLEFRTIVNDKLNNLSEDIDYLKHKEQQNERDIFTLKKKIN